MNEISKNQLKKGHYHDQILTNKEQFLASLGNQGIYGALESKWLTMSEMFPEDARQTMRQALVWVNTMVTNGIPANNLDAAISFILEDYSHLYPDDVMLCVRMGLKGKLIPNYGRIDAQVVYNWFYEYNIQRATAIRIMEARREAAEWRRREAQDAQ